MENTTASASGTHRTGSPGGAAQHGRQRPWTLASRPEQSPLRGTLQCPLQIARPTVLDRSALANFSNRRIRTRTYGGVGGAEPRGSPLSRSLTQKRPAIRVVERLLLSDDRAWSGNPSPFNFTR